MTDRLDKVKNRIRKLLAIAADDSVADGEITAAMNLAEKAMQAYHLEHADLEVENASSPAPHEMKFAKHAGACQTKKLTTWESQLYRAVKILVGSVDAFRTTTMAETGPFRKASEKAALMWYGPAEDAQLAAEIFEEWSGAIAAIAVGRYGNAVQGAGGQYAYGFARGLTDQAKQASEERSQICTASTTALVLRDGGTLSDLLALRAKEGKMWLQNGGVRLRKSYSKRSGYSQSNDGFEAHRAGLGDGRRAEFIAKRTKKLN